MKKTQFCLIIAMLWVIDMDVNIKDYFSHIWAEVMAIIFTIGAIIFMIQELKDKE